MPSPSKIAKFNRAMLVVITILPSVQALASITASVLA